MGELNLNSIKKDSVSKIFGVLARGGSFSRAELAQRTGLSLMTVGKIIALLEKNNALVQYKQNSDSVGRKSSFCELDKNCAALIFDLSSKKYSLHVVDILLQTRAEYAFNFDNLKEKAAEAFFDFTSCGGTIIGTGCVIPNSQKEAADLRKRLTIAQTSKPDVFVSEMNASAIVNSLRFGSETSVHIKLLPSKPESCGAVICGGKIYRGAFGRAGNIEGLLRLCDDPVKMLSAICLTFDPAVIRIECEEISACEELLSVIKSGICEYINGELPEIIAETADMSIKAVCGAMLLLRKNWLGRII